MVQSLNTTAVWTTVTKVLRHPSLLVPHVSVENVSQVNYSLLKDKCGIRAIVFDKDNTLTAPYDSTMIHPDAKAGLEQALAVFGPDKVAILSNSAGTKDDADYKDAQHIQENLGIAVIRHDEKKPGGLKEVMDHFQVDDPASLCMVGDRLLTDVVFGNLYGMLTVHTLPLCKGADNSRDNTVSSIIRTIENSALYGNWLGSYYDPTSQKRDHKYWPGEAECPLRIMSTNTSEPVSEATTKEDSKTGSTR